MSTPPLTFERRIERLEAENRRLSDLLEADSRQPQGRGRRWNFWGVSWEKTGESYPGDGANTFPFRFVDLEYTAAVGTQTLTPHFRTGEASIPKVGRTTNGQWIAPGELCMVSPLPPPPGTEDKGRWLITPQKTWYYGFLQGELGRLSSTSASVYKQDPAGTWTRILPSVASPPLVLTVWDARFLDSGTSLPAKTWVRFEWETVAWVVTNAGCAPEDVVEETE